MSRCFPFPPPGYEKKARPDVDPNFLIKEKHKEKKHKKDQDKEKKEKREKKDKERSSEKDREKKDRKRKREDKKEKNKDKEEKKASEEKKVVGSPGHQNGEKIGPIGIRVDQARHSRSSLELEKRVGTENGAREIRSVDNSSITCLSVKSSGKESESSLGIVVEGNQKFVYKQEENSTPDGQSCQVSEKHLENGFLGNIPRKEEKIVEGAVCHEETSEKQKEQKDKRKHKSSGGRRDKHKDGDGERKSKSKDKKKKTKEDRVKEALTSVQSKLTENGNNLVDIKKDRESNLFKGSSANNGNLSKRKEPEMNGFEHGNGIPINKLTRSLSSSEVNQNGSINNASNPGIQFVMEREATVLKHKLDAKVSCSNSVSENGTKLENRKPVNNYARERQEAINNHHKASDSLSCSQPSMGIGRKLEPSQTAMNFASKEQGVTNHKLHKKVLFSHQVDENGRKFESSQPSNISSAEGQRRVSKTKVDDQGSRINGLVGLKTQEACSKRLSPVAGQLKGTVEIRMKPPHPDTKYLSKILSLPKVEWSDIDDQAWLCAREDQGGKKPKFDSPTFEEPKQVWAEALQLESADVTALPYVIPY